MMNPAPILLFVYNRPDHTQKTIEALKQNTLAKQSDLIIYCDGAKNKTAIPSVEEVRALVDQVTGFKSVRIIKRDRNWGLAPSIIDGVTKALSEYSSVIVLEDDLITHPSFLKFMNDGLAKYAHDDRVASIHGFIYPIQGLPKNFFIRGADCWGWATWPRAWKHFEADGSILLQELKNKRKTKEFDYFGGYGYTQMLQEQIEGKVSSWAVRWYASAFLKNMLTLYPGESLVKNIGYDVGTHCKDGEDEPFFGVLTRSYPEVIDIPVEHSVIAHKKMAKFLKNQKKSIYQRIIQKLKKTLF